MVRKSIFTKRAKEESSIKGFTRNIRFLHSTLKHTVLTDVRVTIYIIQSWKGETCCYQYKITKVKQLGPQLKHLDGGPFKCGSGGCTWRNFDKCEKEYCRGRNSKLAAEHKGAGGQRVRTHAAKRGHMLRSTWRNCLLFPSILLNFTSHRALQ